MKLNKKGFTLVELMVVIVIIGILAAIIIPNVANNIEKANRTAALTDAKNAYTALIGKLNIDKGDVFPEIFVYVENGYTVIVRNGTVKDVDVIKNEATLATDNTLTLPTETATGFTAPTYKAGDILQKDGKYYTYNVPADSATEGTWTEKTFSD